MSKFSKEKIEERVAFVTAEEADLEVVSPYAGSGAGQPSIDNQLDAAGVDDVVGPYAQAPYAVALHDSTSPKQSKRTAKLAQTMIEKARIVSLGSGFLLAAGIGFAIWHHQGELEQDLRSYVDKAELADLNGKHDLSARFYHKAIDTAIQSSMDKKAIGDLHVLAAQQEADAQYLGADESEPAKTPEGTAQLDDTATNDLETALQIYERTPNCKSEQVMTLTKLTSFATGSALTVLNRLSYLDPETRARNHAPVEPDLRIAREGVRLWLHGNLADAAARFRTFLFQQRTSAPILDKAYGLIADLQTRKQFAPAIWLCEELIYYNMDSMEIEPLHKRLDHLIAESRGSADGDARRSQGDEDFSNQNWHGAIIEYLHYLRDKDDNEIRAKFLQAEKMSASAEPEADKVRAIIKNCNKLWTLLQKDLHQGMESSESNRTLETLLDAYLDLADVQGAQKLVTLRAMAFAKVPKVWQTPNFWLKAPPYIEQARIDLHCGRVNEGIRNLKLAAQGDEPKAHEARIKLANIYTEIGDYEAAHRQVELLNQYTDSSLTGWSTTRMEPLTVF